MTSLFSHKRISEDENWDDKKSRLMANLSREVLHYAHTKAHCENVMAINLSIVKSL